MGRFNTRKNYFVNCKKKKNKMKKRVPMDPAKILYLKEYNKGFSWSGQKKVEEECPQFGNVRDEDDSVASAKKICDCGHVFLEKKKRGFQETPVVITSDRLRSSRFQESDCRPVRVKKHKYHGSDFIYSPSKIPDHARTSNPETFGAENEQGTKVDGKLVDKLYPKRDRIKTSKYEDYHSKQCKKIIIVNSENRSYPSCSKEFLYQPKPAKEIEISKLNSQIVENTAAIADNVMLKLEGNISEYQIYRTDTVFEGERCSTGAREYEIEHRKDKVVEKELFVNENLMDSSLSSHAETIEENTEEHDAYIKQLLLTDFSMPIDVVADEDTALSLPHVEDDYFSSDSSGSFVEEEEDRLKCIKLPVRLQNQFIQPERKNPEVDDIPLSNLVRTCSYSDNGPFRINKDGKLKRPVGRPRKHPIIINKVKRPVGRPRKDRTNAEIKRFINGGQKRRGRPPSSSSAAGAVRRPPSFPTGMYAEHLFYDDDEDGDDEDDPDYKSPNKNNTSLNRADRQSRRCFLSPPQLMDRMRIEYCEMIEQEKWAKRFAKKDQVEIPEEKKELYSHILKEINRRILSQAFSCTL